MRERSGVKLYRAHPTRLTVYLFLHYTFQANAYTPIGSNRARAVSQKIRALEAGTQQAALL